MNIKKIRELDINKQLTKQQPEQQQEQQKMEIFYINLYWFYHISEIWNRGSESQ